MNNQNNIYLCPKGFDPHKHEKEKALYCIAETKGDKSFKDYYKHICETESQRIIVNFEKFTKKP